VRNFCKSEKGIDQESGVGPKRESGGQRTWESYPAGGESYGNPGGGRRKRIRGRRKGESKEEGD